ncbi:MAG: 2-C-methyl-D-erythritol 4-phosphate cytidylyltransferase [Phycisphaerales bacterium]|jgi:2-C-methyl-D-erythritol 4-phosphate cytidylyltransferase|nr:2-C-methyl-D-erythritol 4-phosphate cytidylyltransferase [Phycisphaerales bacterium]
MKIAVLIPAAGLSTRFGSKDKLNADLGGRPLLMRTVEFFTKRDEITQIIVAGPSTSFDSFKDRFAAALSFHGVTIVQGGEHRWESVQNALAEVDPTVDRIAIHDAARPALSNALFDTLLAASAQVDAVAPACALTGTIKRASLNETPLEEEEDIADAIFGETGKAKIHTHEIIETVDRSGLWEVQTPQLFETSLLIRAYQSPITINPTDDAQVVELHGEVVHLVEGESRNIKVTTQSDLHLVRAILGIKDAPKRAPHKRF